MAKVTTEKVPYPGTAPDTTDTPDTETAHASSHRTQPLRGFLDAIEVTRTPDEAGGVPLPDAWVCTRAVMGRVSPDTLKRLPTEKERRYAASVQNADDLHDFETVEKHAAKGTHLPAGLHVVTGQTGGGKSALVVNLALAAIKSGHPVLYVSLELDGEELAARVLALETGIPWYKLSVGEPLTPEETQRRQEGRARLDALGVSERFLVHAPLGPLSVQHVHAQALSAWEQFGKVPLVVLDYLQLSTVLASDFRLPLREAIAAVVVEMRHLSRRDKERGWPGCPVVMLSTTARGNTGKKESGIEGLNGETPDAIRRDNLEVLKSLPKEAGEIEATAVTAWVIALGDRTENGTRPLALRLAKNRFGIPGAWVPFTFDGATGKLEEEPDRYAAARAEDAARPHQDTDTASARNSKSAKNGSTTPLASSAPVSMDKAFEVLNQRPAR